MQDTIPLSELKSKVDEINDLITQSAYLLLCRGELEDIEGDETSELTFGEDGEDKYVIVKPAYILTALGLQFDENMQRMRELRADLEKYGIRFSAVQL